MREMHERTKKSWTFFVWPTASEFTKMLSTCVSNRLDCRWFTFVKVAWINMKSSERTLRRWFADAFYDNRFSAISWSHEIMKTFGCLNNSTTSTCLMKQFFIYQRTKLKSFFVVSSSWKKDNKTFFPLFTSIVQKCLWMVRDWQGRWTEKPISLDLFWA